MHVEDEHDAPQGMHVEDEHDTGRGMNIEDEQHTRRVQEVEEGAAEAVSAAEPVPASHQVAYSSRPCRETWCAQQRLADGHDCLGVPGSKRAVWQGRGCRRAEG